MRLGFRSFLGVVGGLAALPSFAPVAAAPPPPQTSAGAPARNVRLFNIPAQPLKTALEAYGAVTGNQIIYSSGLAANRRSSAVVGLFAPETALRMLLDGTDLTIRYSGPGDVTIVSTAQLRAEAAASAAADGAPSGGAGSSGDLVLDTLFVDVPPGAESQPRFTAYGRSVRQEIRRALGEDGATAHRSYQVQFDLWVDDKGRVRRPKMLRSSGQTQLDETILHVIQAITMHDPPPAGLPQPIRVTIVAI